MNIRATYVVRQGSDHIGHRQPQSNVPINVVLTGTLFEPQVVLTSPDSLLSLSPQDLLSYLVTGQQSLTVGQGPTTTRRTRWPVRPPDGRDGARDHSGGNRG